MMPRTPEAELMDETEQARAYAEADFEEPNGRFIELFRQLQPGPIRGRALDLGCGPADITLRFARTFPESHAEGLDGAAAMLAFAERALAQEPGLKPRLRLHCRTLPCPELAAQAYDYLLSNSLLHHLHRPEVLWDTVRRCARPGAAVLVMDLARPASPAAADALVAQYGAQMPPVLREDFRNSLFAAFTPEEVKAQLTPAGLTGLQVRMVSDRHLAISGHID